MGTLRTTNDNDLGLSTGHKIQTSSSTPVSKSNGQAGQSRCAEIAVRNGLFEHQSTRTGQGRGNQQEISFLMAAGWYSRDVTSGSGGAVQYTSFWVREDKLSLDRAGVCSAVCVHSQSDGTCIKQVSHSQQGSWNSQKKYTTRVYKIPRLYTDWRFKSHTKKPGLRPTVSMCDRTCTKNYRETNISCLFGWSTPAALGRERTWAYEHTLRQYYRCSEDGRSITWTRRVGLVWIGMKAKANATSNQLSHPEDPQYISGSNRCGAFGLCRAVAP